MNKEHEKKTEQTNSQLVKDLAYIKQLMELQTRNTAAGASPYFIIWGIIWIIGFGADALGFDHLLPWIWGGLSIIGMILNLTIGIKQAKEDPLPTVFDRKLSMLFSVFWRDRCLLHRFDHDGFVHFSADVIGLYSVIFVSILYLLIGVILGKECFYHGDLVRAARMHKRHLVSALPCRHHDGFRRGHLLDYPHHAAQMGEKRWMKIPFINWTMSFMRKQGSAL